MTCCLQKQISFCMEQKPWDRRCQQCHHHQPQVSKPCRLQCHHTHRRCKNHADTGDPMEVVDWAINVDMFTPGMGYLTNPSDAGCVLALNILVVSALLEMLSPRQGGVPVEQQDHLRHKHRRPPPRRQQPKEEENPKARDEGTNMTNRPSKTRMAPLQQGRQGKRKLLNLQQAKPR